MTAKFLAGGMAHVFNAGAPVWGLDWCPIHADERPRKYSRSSPLPTLLIFTACNRPFIQAISGNSTFSFQFTLPRNWRESAPTIEIMYTDLDTGTDSGNRLDGRGSR